MQSNAVCVSLLVVCLLSVWPLPIELSPAAPGAAFSSCLAASRRLALSASCLSPARCQMRLWSHIGMRSLMAFGRAGGRRRSGAAAEEPERGQPAVPQRGEPQCGRGRQRYHSAIVRSRPATVSSSSNRRESSNRTGLQADTKGIVCIRSPYSHCPTNSHKHSPPTATAVATRSTPHEVDASPTSPPARCKAVRACSAGT